jgi:RNA polymerase sigma-54 factor
VRIAHEIKLEQTQKLVITPELQQAITLLQLSALELSQYLEEELMINPVLEVSEGEGEEIDPKEAEAEKEKEKEKEKDKEKEIDWDEYFQEQMDSDRPYVKRAEEETSNYENYVANTQSLQEHLLLELGLIALSPQEYLVGEFIIGNIDENGYLKGNLQEFSRLLGVPLEILEKVLGLIQGFEPAGVGARSVKECLLLQLKEKQNVDPLTEVVISEHLSQVADNRLREIAQDLEADPARIQTIVDFIRSLDPKPGCTFGGSRETRYILPDLVVEKVKDDYVIIVNDTLLPRLTINSYYRSMLKRKDESAISTFIKKRLDSAVWLIKSIEQRRLTLYRVMDQIVTVQSEFFHQGIRHLKPLTLRDIADKLGIHESTVSRATANKYVQTPRGIFPLKFFFSSGVETSGGDSVASSSIKHFLRELIEEENARKPLSDQKLADLLEKIDIVISRRTVTKYREEMRIPASSRRKRH